MSSPRERIAALKQDRRGMWAHGTDSSWLLDYAEHGGRVSAIFLVIGGAVCIAIAFIIVGWLWGGSE